MSKSLFVRSRTRRWNELCKWKYQLGRQLMPAVASPKRAHQSLDKPAASERDAGRPINNFWERCKAGATMGSQHLQISRVDGLGIPRIRVPLWPPCSSPPPSSLFLVTRTKPCSKLTSSPLSHAP